MLCECKHEREQHAPQCKLDCPCKGFVAEPLGAHALIALTFNDGTHYHEYRFYIPREAGITVNNYREYFARIARLKVKAKAKAGLKAWIVKEFGE